MHTLHDFIYCQNDPQDGTIVLCTVQDELEVHADHGHSWPSRKYIQLNYFIGTIGDCYSAFFVHFCADFVPPQVCCIYWIMNMYRCCVIILLRHRQIEKTVSNMTLDFKVMKEKPTKMIGSYTECWSFHVETIVRVNTDQAVWWKKKEYSTFAMLFAILPWILWVTKMNNYKFTVVYILRDYFPMRYKLHVPLISSLHDTDL